MEQKHKSPPDNYKKSKYPRSGKGRPFHHKKEPNPTVEASLYAPQFIEFQKELDDKNDRYERLVQKSRDLTIESKRIIFQLHRIVSEEGKSDILEQVQVRIKEAQKRHLKGIALEIHNCDFYRYHRAFTAGIQEYIEAVTFYYYHKENRLVSWEEIQKDFTFIDEKSNQTLFLPLTPKDYILGVADLTGELMRKCINSVGLGNLDEPFVLCQFLQALDCAFQTIGGSGGREIGRKIATLRASLVKVEKACYALQIRGSEIPQSFLADLLADNNEHLNYYPSSDHE